MRSQDIESLVAAVAGFLRDDGCRALHVVVDPEVRRGAIDLVMAQEYRPTNVAPFVLLEQPHTRADPGWASRTAALRQQHDARRVGHEDTIAALPAAPTGPDDRGLFALQLQQLMQATPEHTEGLVVVLAPTQIDAHTELTGALDLLLARGGLARARWIVIEADGDRLRAWVDAARGRRIDLRQSPAAIDAEVAALVEDRPGASPRGVTPPARPDVPDRTPDADGLRRREIGRLSLQASLAASRGQGAQAVAAQRSARDLAAAAGWTSDAITMEIALGAHLVGAGATREAETTFVRAIESAQQHGMHDKATTAGFGLAATRTVRGERHTALVAYADAALAAERSGSPVLAIEANRLAGQAALDLRMEPQAITFFAKAVELADAAGSIGPSSAGIAARTLATLCRRRGLDARAIELDHQADRFDAQAGTAPTQVPDAAPTPEVAPSWTPAETESLRRAIDHSLGEDASQILSRDELDSLQGRGVGPDAEEP